MRRTPSSRGSRFIAPSLTLGVAPSAFAKTLTDGMPPGAQNLALALSILAGIGCLLVARKVTLMGRATGNPYGMPLGFTLVACALFLFALPHLQL